MSSLKLPASGHYLLFLLLLSCMLLIVNFIRKGYQARRRMIVARDHGLPLLPGWSYFWGSLKTIGEIAASLPENVHGHVLPAAFRKKFPDLPPIFAVDLWPISDQTIMCTSPEACDQITQERSLSKHKTLGLYLRPLMGLNNIITMEGHEWKFWRGIFNPGFRLTHLTTLVPGIVQDALAFCSVLEQHAKAGDLFQMEDATARCTMDIIGRVIL